MVPAGSPAHPRRCRQPGRDPVAAAQTGGSDQIVDVLGVLEQADARSLAVRTRDGKLVVIPAGRALAGKVVPPAPARNRRASPGQTDRPPR
jgi:hypothetical protein